MGKEESHMTKKSERKDWGLVKATKFALLTHNSIRSVISNLKLEPHPNKMMIALSIGDPTTFGNLKPSLETVEAVTESLESFKYNGYGPSTGLDEARQAIAEYSSNEHYTVDTEDVIICSGCSSAIELCISALCESGKNLLCPKPGFTIYRTHAQGFGVEIREYNLLPDQQWEIDLEDLERQIDENTAAIIINNPSNPCGSVFTQRHLRDIVQLASRNYIPIIADEIYEHMVFNPAKFIPIASLSDDVPILSCSGVTKRFLVPGWRTGWIVVHDRNRIFEKEVRRALVNLSSRILGSNTLVQGALPKILKNTPQSFFDNTINIIQRHAEIAYSLLKEIDGLKPTMPQGAMYMMVGVSMPQFPEFKNVQELLEKLVAEESVFCLPGECFSYPGYFRIVLTVPEEILVIACTRMKEFFSNHRKRDTSLFNRIIST